jgi:hypothetical protein
MERPRDRALAVAAFEGVAPQPGFTHALFPRAAFDESAGGGTRAFARGGEGLAALVASGPPEEIGPAPAPAASCASRARRGRWMVRLGTAGRGSLDGFRGRFGEIAPHEPADGRIVVDDPDYGVVVFHPDGTVVAEGRTLDPASWSV